MRIQSPYSLFIEHLDKVFTDPTSVSYKTEDKLKNFCKNLTKVINAADSFNNLVSNSSGSRIIGEFSHLKKFTRKIPQMEEDIIDSIDKAKLNGDNLTCHSKAQEKIYKDIGKLENLIKTADLWTLWIVPPTPSKINVPHGKLILAQAYLYEFMNEREIFNYFSNHGYYPPNGYNRPRNDMAVNRVRPSAPPAVNHDLPGYYETTVHDAPPPSYEQAMREGRNQRINAATGSSYTYPAGY